MSNVLNVTLLAQCISFMLAVWLAYRFCWPPFERMMADREAKVRAGIENAARAETQLHLAQASAKEYLRKAKQSANELETAAQQVAADIQRVAQKKADEERLDILAQGKQQLAMEARKVSEMLQQEAVDSALAIAEQILRIQTVDVTFDLLKQSEVQALLKRLPTVPETVKQ